MSSHQILFVLPSLRAGGAEKVVIRLANYLAREGEDVGFATLDCTGELRGDLDPSIPLYDLQVPKTRYAPGALLRLIRRLKPRLVFSSLTRVSLLLLLMRPLFPPDTRIVVRQPSIASSDLQSIEPRWLYGLLFGRLIPTADLVVSQSDAMSADLVRVLAPRTARLVEVPNPAPVVDRQGLLARGSPFVGGVNLLAVGRLSPEKGYENLLAAFARLAASRNDVHLTVIGNGPLATELREKSAALGLSDRVTFLGFLADPFPYYVHADALVLASRWEGFPNVVLEALASGIPVVATPCGGVTAEIVVPGSNGVIVREGGVEELCRGMAEVLELRSRVAPEDLAQSIGRFTAEDVFARYRQVLSELLARN
ncbi:MAG: glycosyltransferase [Chromatiales bacterium]|nr:glycosyltransferase [Chromatiales bacterium]